MIRSHSEAHRRCFRVYCCLYTRIFDPSESRAMGLLCLSKPVPAEARMNLLNRYSCQDVSNRSAQAAPSAVYDESREDHPVPTELVL